MTMAHAAPSEPAPSAGANPAAAQPAPPSLSARKVYEQARPKLVQIRTLLKGQASQTSVGSGFVVSSSGHIITNYHVVSQFALKPGRHYLVYVTADGREAPLVLLKIDVLHDLALLKAADESSGPFDALTWRSADNPLAQGERIYALGNPLDVGFAATEGTYNGLVKRSFYPQIFYGGTINAGMSGGPALDQQGQVIGINVARRVDGEQVAFMVPSSFAKALFEAGKEAKALPTPVYAEATAQLLVHQEALAQRFIAQGWKDFNNAHYRVPVPRDEFMRCWGSSQPSKTAGMDLERSDCVMDSRVFLGEFNTGTIEVRHESYDGHSLGALRFAERHGRSFANESFRRLGPEHQTQPQCRQSYLNSHGLVVRAVVCFRAYKKLTDLFDVSVLVASLDQDTAGVQGRLDVRGVGFANGQRLARHYLDAFGLTAKP